MTGSYSISYDKKYMIATISKVYQSKSNYRKQLGISYMYGKVSDINSLARDYENKQKNNLDRQTEFLKVLACFGIVLLPIILAVAVVLCSTYYTSNEEAAFLRSKTKGKKANSYIGFLYSWSDYSF